jgi:hypothetical protein
VQALEFFARPENGVIQIPEKYNSVVSQNKNVIVIIKEVSSVSDLLIPPTLDTRGWKFNKEEANER